ncbi:MAG: MBL fold metallo-hydrolase [Vicinamibacterales bacterium]
MRRVTILTVVLLVASGAASFAQEAGALQTATTALGATSIRTLQFSASGGSFSLGQNFTPSEPWPKVTIKSYTASINYEQGSMRVDLVREMGTTMPRGGGAAFTGEQRQTQIVSGAFAWNQQQPPLPSPPTNQATPAAQVERMLMVWTTPQGFVRAATTNNATIQRNKNGTTMVSFSLPSGQKMTGTLNAQGQVVKVQSWIYQPIVGDMLVETTYDGYKDFGGVMFPSRLVQRQDGFPTLDLTIQSVTANPTVDLPVPASVLSAPAPAPPTVASEKLGDGLYYLTGGSHHGLAIEMRDHIVVVDLPNNQARAQAVLTKAKELIPNKPVRYVVTSHHHWDHLGGIREAFAEGATVVTHESNKAFLERVARVSHTISPDRQAAVNGKAKIQTVKEKGILTDGSRVVELHLLTGYEHTGDMLVVYLPKEKVLAEPDAYNPPVPTGSALVITAVPYARALYDNIQRLKLDVAVIVPFHGPRKSDVAELAKSIGVPSAAN